ncbi:uncharacterized protein C8Q71DRAFT_722460 [Rhodofomes roseus]|uniref:Uncharacterized protein n=1 Tax=Rhodofomes roseus TaxID=34475 RepID=A0ABQ8KJA0_9APHY|nr:uncharacterized protein C8Q71DRAFT_722460 [Rhodofomes roseus]KAH9838217.1 hypothetical protein C8Q71DRAFT_722460 [Rhodofomes roseus]
MSSAAATSRSQTRQGGDAGSDDEDAREFVPVKWTDMPEYITKVEQEIVGLMGGPSVTDEQDKNFDDKTRDQFRVKVGLFGHNIVHHFTEGRYFAVSRFLASALTELAHANQHGIPIQFSRVSEIDERIAHHWLLFPPNHPRHHFHLQMREHQEAAEKRATAERGAKILEESKARKEATRAAQEKKTGLKGPKGAPPGKRFRELDGDSNEEDGGEVDQLDDDHDEEMVRKTLQLKKGKGKAREVPPTPPANEDEGPSGGNPAAIQEGGQDVDNEEEEEEQEEEEQEEGKKL